ncbi:MAG: replication initiation protein [Gammaproteobacteria bacterium]|nr:replication initiation protein [Gammaproteobacteria bacterium]
MPYFTDLQRDFTWYCLRYVRQLRSTHSVGLYELLMRPVNKHKGVGFG